MRKNISARDMNLECGVELMFSEYREFYDYDNDICEGKVRIPSGCAIAGLINRESKKVKGDTIAKMMAVMHERSNGLGGGFAAYGIYPEHNTDYAFHLLFMDNQSKKEVEADRKSTRLNSSHVRI